MSMSSILQVLYTCHGCGIKDRKVTVRHRMSGEDILRWMKDVQTRVGSDHALQSPNCHKGVADLKIPVSDTNHIGYAESQPS